MSTENQKEPVKILLPVLTEQVEKGMKRKELAEYYGLSEVQMAKALKEAGLKIRRFHAPKFELLKEETVSSEAAKEVVAEEASTEEVGEKVGVEEASTETSLENSENSPRFGFRRFG